METNIENKELENNVILCEAGKEPVDIIMERLYPAIYHGYNQARTDQSNLFYKKHLDYGMKNIAAGTNLKTGAEKAFALEGLWFRISDKVNRWQNMMLSGRPVNNESLSDTFDDIANYATIAKLVLEDKWIEG
jgi:hypothetical protein